MRRGRRRKFVERYANGKIRQPQAAEDVRKPVWQQRRRLFHVSRADQNDPELESIVGRMHRAELLEDIQFHAARALAHAVRGFVSVAGGPRFMPKISGIYANPMQAQPTEEIAELLNQQAERYLTALASLAADQRQLVWTVCIEERDVTLSQAEIVTLQTALTGLISNIRR